MAIGPYSETINRILDHGADGVMALLMQAYRNAGRKDEFVAALAFELLLRIRSAQDAAPKRGEE
ncbi:hypothetical protein B447_10713 [Thauera sp. 27]|uniref:hypothetical protein n=1 Tax=Thauera sp. 27 TaxID=305700 RepID=UPI0002CF6009|nr:hypothetical protein [Thauera sp. 27]ENO80932.1 hypothetical protein B447_10713 [Thauera sp. 27]